MRKKQSENLDSFRSVFSILPEQEKILYNHVYGKRNDISSQFIEIHSVSNETIPKIATNLKTPEMNEKK